MSATAPTFSLSPDAQDHLYETYRRLRDDEPLHRDEARGVWVLTRDADVRRALLDTERLRNSGTGQDIVPQFQATDAPIQPRLRKAIQARMSPRAMQAFEPLVRKVTSELFDALADRAHCDLLTSVIQEVPRRVASPVVGFPEACRPLLYEVTDPLVGIDPDDPTPTLPADNGPRLREIVKEILDEKRARPGDDLISALLEAEAAGRLTPEESLIAASGFAFAAFDTTRNLLANGTALLAAHPEQRARLIEDPGLIPNAIEEMLRCESPAQVEPRRVAAPISFHGVELPVGDEVLLYLGSANRDERKWDAPERFDVGRKCRDHLAFGHGLHLCVGQHLARLEARVYFETLLERMPDYRVGATRHYISPWARALVTLPVEIRGRSGR